MPRPRKKTTKQKPLGTEGKRVSAEIIKGHQMEINKLKTELKKTTDPVQKDILVKQIRLEGLNLARFKRQTK